VTVLVPARAPEGLDRVLVLEDNRADRQGMRLYYGPVSVVGSMTIDDFLGAGGIVVSEWKSDGQSAQVVFDAVGKRAIPVAIGPYDAAMVHGDEISTRIRPYGLYWSDGSRDFSILSGVDRPETTIDLARSIYCP
jgi:hypothetical protein